MNASKFSINKKQISLTKQRNIWINKSFLILFCNFSWKLDCLSFRVKQNKNDHPKKQQLSAKNMKKIHILRYTNSLPASSKTLLTLQFFVYCLFSTLPYISLCLDELWLSGQVVQTHRIQSWTKRNIWIVNPLLRNVVEWSDTL